MARSTKVTGVRVVIDMPDQRFGSVRRQADDYIKEIKRHVDLDSSHSPEVEDVEEHTCGFCKCEWTEQSHQYNGGCCDADEDAELARRAPAKPSMPEHILGERSE